MDVQEGGSNGATSARDGAAELFARHSTAIYRYCLRRLRSPEEAEDALQATYLNAWRSLQRGFAPENPRPWLFQIAANVCSGTLRSKLGGTRLELHAPEALEDMVQVEQPERDAFLDLTEAVRGLPDRQRRALFLRDWHGLRYDEIAARMAVSDAAVETLLVRARSKVAATLAGREWRSKLATSARALVLWPFGLFQAKSAAASSSAPLKVGLTVACGTVAPLVAFGVLQALVFPPEGTKEANRNRVSAPVARIEPAVSPVAEKTPSRPVDAGGGEERKPPASGEGPEKSSAQARKAEQPKSEAATSAPPSSSDAPPSDAPTSQPPPVAAPHEGNVVVCHQTGSKKNPGVTLHVSAQAAKHGHSKDPAGPCS